MGFFEFIFSLFMPKPAYAETLPQPVVAASTAFGKTQAAQIVRRLNSTEFGNWFSVGDVMAIIEIESSFNPRAYRYEAALKDASYGLMQILYMSAKDRGYTGTAFGLYDSETNIRYGMRHLKWSYTTLTAKLGKQPTKEQWIMSYNAGVGAISKGKTVILYWTKFQKARKNY